VDVTTRCVQSALMACTARADFHEPLVCVGDVYVSQFLVEPQPERASAMALGGGLRTELGSGAHLVVVARAVGVRPPDLVVVPTSGRGRPRCRCRVPGHGRRRRCSPARRPSQAAAAGAVFGWHRSSRRWLPLRWECVAAPNRASTATRAKRKMSLASTS
jgi:hypothetical protein